MNEKSAKVFTHKMHGHIHDDRAACAPCIAIGYLEALEKAKVLEEALKWIDDYYDFEDAGLVANTALAKWEKEK